MSRKAKRHTHAIIPLLVAGLVLGVVFVGRPAEYQPGNTELAFAAGLGGISTVDEFSAAQIAADIARGADLIVADNVQNLADSHQARVEFSTKEGSYLTKPQQVVTEAKTSGDIQTYVVKSGDTISSIARKFNITSDTIRWENNLTGDSVAAGTRLTILPISGLRYTVREGDTAASIAERYEANANFIIAFNDAELTGLKPGMKIIIPGAEKPAPQPTYFSSGYGFSFGSSPLYGGNGYSYGYCTYYVATRVSVPRNWGNANTWDTGAVLSGWIVSPKPRAGAVAQTDGMSYLGHVAYVEEVSADGLMVKISDMNGIAGWNAVGVGWFPTGTFENYLYR